MKIIKTIPAPEYPSQSTFLVGDQFIEMYMKPRFLKGKRLSWYLNKLLCDPQLEYKLNLLKPSNWRKIYQEEGQDLVPLYFYPDEYDWARLSIISNATGYSRCYIFVYLMLLDLGILKIKKNITKEDAPVEVKYSQVFCRIFIDEREQILVRTIKALKIRKMTCRSE
jgi:hypothetical protein